MEHVFCIGKHKEDPPQRNVRMKGRIRVAVASNRHQSPSFSASLAMLMAHSVVDAERFERVGLTMIPWNSCLPMARTDCVGIALANGSSHILFIDDDLVFPADALQGLFSRGKRIVGANYVRKTIPATWIAQDFEGEDVSSTKRQGIEDVKRIGLGLALIDLAVFEKMTQPWFSIGWSEENGHMSEDTWFCNKALNFGEEVWVDHDLAKYVRHAGEFLYGPEHVLRERTEGDLHDET